MARYLFKFMLIEGEVGTLSHESGDRRREKSEQVDAS